MLPREPSRRGPAAPEDIHVQFELAIPAGDVKLMTNMQIYGVHELPVSWTETAR